MAAQIDIEKLREDEFRVRINDGATESQHLVTLSQKDYQRLSGGKIEAAELIKRSFEFLLAREGKESILPRFDLPLIGRYFPEYERELKGRI
jgi:hypothetical protein